MFKQNNINWVVAGGALLTILTFVAGKFGIVLPDDVKQAILVLILALTGGGIVALHNVWNVPAARQKAQDLLVQAGNVPIGRAQDLVKVMIVALLLPLFLMGCGALGGANHPPTSVPGLSSDNGATTISTTVVPQSDTDVLQQISQFTINDLAAADADAVAHNDTISHLCYPALTRFVESIPAVNGTVSGAFSLFQRGRDLRNMAAGGVPDYLLIGCGPLVAQVRGDILKLLSGFAGGVVGAPAILPVIH